MVPGIERHVDTIDHGSAMAVQNVDHLIVALVTVLAHVATRGNGLRTEPERRLHRHSARCDQHVHEAVGRNRLPIAGRLTWLDHQNLAIARLACVHIVRSLGQLHTVAAL